MVPKWKISIFSLLLIAEKINKELLLKIKYIQANQYSTAFHDDLKKNFKQLLIVKLKAVL